MSAQFTEDQYKLANSWTPAGRRLAGLQQTYDPGTHRRLATLGVQPGWRCLEVGAGGGSITRWLAERVGPQGSVVAADIDTGLLVDMPANVEVRRMDVRTDPLPEAEFDLVHIRMVLNHVAEPEKVLRRLAATVRPGGVLLLEEGDSSPVEVPPENPDEALHREVSVAHLAILARAADIHLGRKVPALVRACGLIDVAIECEVPIAEGGTPGIEWLRLSYEQLREKAGGEVVDPATWARWQEMTEQPGRWFATVALVAVAARRPA
jgi:SAM-dependent methyltransferase